MTINPPSAHGAVADQQSPDGGRLHVGTEPGEVVEAMGDPGFYDASASEVVELRETHASLVSLVGDRAFKLKKPVVFPFLDYGSVERRRVMCAREIELNRQLADDVYVGLRTVVRRDGHLRLGEGDALGAIDYLVEMRRYDEAATLAAAVVDGRADTRSVAGVGRRLAAFHAVAAPHRQGEERLAGLTATIDGNFDALAGHGNVIAPSRVLAAQRFADAFVCGHRERIVERARTGFVREGHGDIRAEHILLGAAVRVVDCVEFDDALRTIDVGEDLAFLVMDLERLGRPDLGRALVDGYRAAGGDPGDEALIAFYAAIKAWVRSKIALSRASELDVSPESQIADFEATRDLFALGERLAWRARLPLALVICGPPASGKSELAAVLGDASGLPVLASDEIRKVLVGIEPTQRAPQSAYAAELSQRTYSMLGRRAAERLSADGGVIIDATFGRASLRRAFIEAFGKPDLLQACECRAPAAVIRQRARSRLADPQRISDAGPAIAARLAAEFEPLDAEFPARRHVVLRADQPVLRLADDLLAMLDRRLAQAADPALETADPGGGSN